MDRSSDHVDTVDVWGQTQHVLREGHSLSLCGPGQGRVCHVGVSSGCAQYVWQGVSGGRDMQGVQVGVSSECDCCIWRALSLTLCPSLRPCGQHVETLHGRSCSDEVIHSCDIM